MNKLIVAFFTALFFTLTYNHVFAQDVLKDGEMKATKRDTKNYNLVSIDGKHQKVTIIPGYKKHELKVTCLKDNITIPDFWGVPPETRLLNKSFIEIKYAVRGGSNVGLCNTLIVCVNDNNLCPAMYALRYANGETGDQKEEYRIKLNISGNNANNYKLNVHIHDYVNSKRDPETNYVYDNNTVLAFDKKLNVFYSVKDGLYDHFITTKSKTKQKVTGIFPMIILGKETYYFINGRWYTGDLDKEMFEFQ